MEIYLARHGQTSFNRDNKMQGIGPIPLTKEGIDYIHSIACKSKDAKIDTIYVSELLRAQQTAAVYKEYFDVPVIGDSRLNEIDVGDFEGRYFDDLRNEHGEVFDLWSAGDFYNVDIPNGEQFVDIENRLRDFITDIHKQSFEDQSILIVSHYVIIKLFISIIFTDNLNASNLMRINLGNIAKLSLNKTKKWSLQYFNLPIIK
tara:strand:+ start:675 stop:1283 length:609 start_codon:yes stop_codon:yes gene_type:complete